MLILRWALIAALTLWAWRRRSLTTWILLSMVVGAEVGYDWPGVAVSLRLLSQIFIRMIKTIIAPLIFATLVVGIAGHPNLRHVGRMGLKALVYFEVVTTLALFIGLAAINLSQAGAGLHAPEAMQPSGTRPPPQSLSDVVLSAFPENVAKAVAEGHVLQVVVFSLLLAVALSLIGEEKRRPLLAFCESLAAAMFKFTNLVMLFAPIGVGAAIAYTVGHMGIGVLVNLAKVLATLYVGARGVPAAGAAAGRARRSRAAQALREGDRRAGVDRVRHHQLRGRAAAARWSAWSSSAFRGRPWPS